MPSDTTPWDRLGGRWLLIGALLIAWGLPTSVQAAPRLIEIVATPGVERGRPTDPRAAFSFADKQMYVWMHLRDADAITLRWYRNENYITANTLQSTGPEWRTWMRRRFRAGDAGRWRVDVVDGERVLGEVTFTVGVVEPAPAPRSVSTDAPAQPAPPVIDLVEAMPRDVAPDGCRALINFRVSPEGEPPRYAVADVSFDDFAQVEHAPGLIVQDAAGAFHALEVRRRTHGNRSWDELIAAPMDARGAPRRWVHLPGAQPLPAPARLREQNRMTVLSTIGPYVGIDATMRSAIDGTRADNSRYLTADATGALIDLRRLLGVGLEIMVQRAGGGADFDYRQLALVPERGLIAMFAASRIPLLSPPEMLRRFSPDADDVWRKGRCAVRLAGHRIAAGVDGAPLREIQARRLLPYAILGLYWINPGTRSPLDRMRDAQRRIARLP